MSRYDHRTRQEHREHSYAIAEEHYSEHAAAAHELIINYLLCYDRELLLIYTGEKADPDFDAFSIDSALCMIASLLQQKSIGNPKVTDEQIDQLARVYLGLPFAMIDGGKA